LCDFNFKGFVIEFLQLARRGAMIGCWGIIQFLLKTIFGHLLQKKQATWGDYWASKKKNYKSHLFKKKQGSF